MTDLSLFRIYEPHELGDDGYPLLWHEGVPVLNANLGVKHLVRAQAENRCVRCGHPFVVGESGVMQGPHADTKALAADLGLSVETFDRGLELFSDGRDDPIVDLTEEQLAKTKRVNWSPCDEHCTHGGPFGVRHVHNGPIVSTDRQSEIEAARMVAPHPHPALFAAWRILTVHHLNGRKHDLRWWNLISVCQRCHLWLQRRVIMERVYPFEHDDYFKPYAAGWYAYAYLGESLTREQTVERMDELLALERAA